MLSGGLRAGEYRSKRTISTPLVEIVVEVDLVEAGSWELGEPGVDVVLNEIGGGIERAAEALASLSERESVVLVEVAAGSFGVLDDECARDIVIVEDLSQPLAVVVLEPGGDRRDAGVARLVSSDGVGDTLGDEYRLTVLDGSEAVDGFGDTSVGLGVGGFGVFPTQPVFGMTVVADSTAALAAGRP